MDPYLEAHWSDWHGPLLQAICDQLNPQIKSRFRAVVAERITANVPSTDSVGDDSSTDDRLAAPPSEPSSDWRDPLILPLPYDEPALRIQVHDTAASNRAVTIIELLCPANKANRSLRDDWAWKQLAVRRSGANLVEIDLTRQGRRKLSAFPIPRSHRTTYQACVYRSFSHPRKYEVYAMPLQGRLPLIRIPLRHRTNDAVLDLQPLIDAACPGTGSDTIDYTRPPVPPLSRTDAAWAAELLSASRNA